MHVCVSNQNKNSQKHLQMEIPALFVSVNSCSCSDSAGNLQGVSKFCQMLASIID